MIVSADTLAAVAARRWYVEEMNTYKLDQNADRVPELAFAVPTSSYHQILLLGWSIYKLRYLSFYPPHTGSSPSVFLYNWS